MGNIMTGDVYRGDFAINAAIARGEPIVEVSEQVARFLEIGKTADGASLADLAERVKVLEGKDDIQNRMKACGLVLAEAVR